VNIEQMSVSEFDAGQGTTTPATVTPLVAAGFGRKSYKSVRVRALATNTGSILIGPTSLSASSGYNGKSLRGLTGFFWDSILWDSNSR
jgi:hypothetical protein